MSYGANEYEKKQQAAAIKDALEKPVTMASSKVDGKEYLLTGLDMFGHQWRQQATQIVKVLDPETYTQYKAVKYGKGDQPDLETRKAAYKIIVERCLELSYRVAGV